MDIQTLQISDYEKVVKAYDEASGLRAIIAVHNTNLGPAVGGTRLYPYATEGEALNDVLRLSKGMTYKSSLAGIDFGGGKSVIIADRKDKTPELLHAFGRFVDTLNGQYICAEDVNTSVADMEIIRETTPHVAGSADKGGDPSPLTALGVYTSIEKIASKLLDTPMRELTVAVQGVGHVGKYLVEHLTKGGAKVYIGDIRENKVKELAEATGAIPVEPENIMSQECDIFSPCAMGAVLNDDTIPALNCKAVVGAANNQLEKDKHADMLHERGILYAPDYLVNAGGIINVFVESQPGGYDPVLADTKVRQIGDTLLEIFRVAKEQDILPVYAANVVAEHRFMKHGEAA